MNFDLVYILILVEVPCVAQFYPMFVNNLSCLELESLKINSKGRTHEFCNIYQMEINNWKQIHVIVRLCLPNRLGGFFGCEYCYKLSMLIGSLLSLLPQSTLRGSQN